MQQTDEIPAQFESLVAKRRSVRGFLPQTVDRSRLREILSTAGRAPSNCNVQPWRVHVVSGEALDRMADVFVAAVTSRREAVPDFALTPRYEGRFRERQVAAAMSLFAATGVDRNDSIARENSMLRNYRFFGAPHAAFITIPDWAGYREAADCGMFVQSLALALTSHGLASCIQGALSHYADLVHRELALAQDERVLMGLSFGYEDPANPANAARTDRMPVDDFVTFHDDLAAR